MSNSQHLNLKANGVANLNKFMESTLANQHTANWTPSMGVLLLCGFLLLTGCAITHPNQKKTLTFAELQKVAEEDCRNHAKTFVFNDKK